MNNHNNLNMQLKHGFYALMFLGFTVSLTGCSDDNPWSGGDGKGGIKLNLHTSSEVLDVRPTRAEAGNPEAPAPEEFNIRLEKSDGSYSKTWNTLSSFSNESSFDTGSYLITAFYGNPENEGFDMPYFEGSANITVLEAREAEASITASLANCMVSIDYTDAFKKYFSTFATTLHSEGHSYVNIPAGELRAAYLNPGNIDIAVDVTRNNGQSVTLQPASFNALPKHHYHITFDVNNGQVGDAELTIQFDESLVQEDVKIDLTDELFSSPAPSIIPSGFTNGGEIELLEHTPATSPLKFTVIARGGLEECNLTIASSSWTPSFGKEINLIAATPSQQQQIEETGIKVAGLYKNIDRMASVNITDLAANLPAGDYTVSLQAKDRYTRVSEPISLNIKSVPVELNATAGDAVLGVNTAVINVVYNGSNPNSDISFKALDQYGAWKECEVKNVALATRSRSIESKEYIFTLTLPDTQRSVIPVQIYVKGSLAQTVEIKVVQPEYDLQADPFANQIILKVTSENPSQIPTVTHALNVFINGNKVPATSLGYNTDSGMIFVKGLEPSTNYELTASLTNASDPKAKKLNLQTEAAQVIPNGNFASTHETINIPQINTGGTYSGTVGIMRTYQIKSSILRNEADGWASINAKTCYTGSNPMNTWFCAPSTWVENGVATVRSVGFNHAGTLPKRYEKTAVYYNINAPSFGDADKAAGELFLGSYTFNGSESRSEGMTFGSRPSALSFSYTYTPVGNEKGVAIISVLNEAGQIISSAREELAAAPNPTEKTVALSPYTFGSRATSIQVKFLSSNASIPSINIPTGNDLNEGVGALNFTNPPAVATNEYKAVATGSVLTLRNVKLVY